MNNPRPSNPLIPQLYSSIHYIVCGTFLHHSYSTPPTRLESERTLLLDKISSLSSEKDVLREEVDMLRECDLEKAALLGQCWDVM